MAVKPLEIHPEALAELKSALSWYLERNETAAVKFAAELDRAMDLLIATPQRWPTGEHDSRKIRPAPLPVCHFLSGEEAVIQVLAIAHGHRRRILEGSALSASNLRTGSGFVSFPQGIMTAHDDKGSRPLLFFSLDVLVPVICPRSRHDRNLAPENQDHLDTLRDVIGGIIFVFALPFINLVLGCGLV